MFRPALALLTSLSLALPVGALADQRGYTHQHGVGGPVHQGLGGQQAASPEPQQDFLGANGSTLAVLGGLAALAILNKKRRDRDEEEEAAAARNAARYTHSHDGLGYHTHRERGNHTAEHRNRGDIGHARGRGHGHGAGRDHGNRNRGARDIPPRCFRRIQSRDGLKFGYGARCMQQSVRRPGLLPPNCIRRIDRPGHREPHYIYGPNCLNSEGWRDARR